MISCRAAAHVTPRPTFYQILSFCLSEGRDWRRTGNSVPVPRPRPDQDRGDVTAPPAAPASPRPPRLPWRRKRHRTNRTWYLLKQKTCFLLSDAATGHEKTVLLRIMAVLQQVVRTPVKTLKRPSPMCPACGPCEDQCDPQEGTSTSPGHRDTLSGGPPGP